MSYCRWSSDDYACDVCVQEADGWITHVAGNRVVPCRPMPQPISYEDDPDAFFERHQEVLDIVSESEHEPIGLEHDGAYFNDPTPGAAADRLEMLREAGYNVPQYAIDSLREEKQDED